MNQVNDLRGKILLNNFRNKTTIRHLKKVIKDDLEAVKKDGNTVFFSRWVKRGKRVFLIPSFIGALLNNLNIFLPRSLRKHFLNKRLDKSREEFQKIKVANPSEIKKIDEVLSVVINTKNSPDYFHDTLRRYKYQVGFRDVEIVIVDSGSTDDTLKIAKAFDSKIIQIRPEEFKHGKSRNLGLEAASGKYIINAVSDAVPSTLDLAFKVATKLEEQNAAAVSVRQIPRFDADLFAVWTFWQHYKFIFGELNRDVWIEKIKNFDSLSNEEQRKLAIIDDVFVMHRADVIKKEKYDNNISYAEDVVLALNYIKKGYKIGILQSEAVIHSHTRPEEYFFKRYFVDANVINEVFKLLPNNLVKKNLVLEDNKAESRLYSIIAMAKEELEKNKTDSLWLNRYLTFFNDNNEIDKNISQIWSELYKDILASLENFSQKTGGFVSGVKDCEDRIIAMTSGTLLSEYLLRYSSKKKLPQKFSEFKSLMERGI